MATADGVKAKLENLIAKANSTTGNGDADLNSAIDTLISGYGQGGSGEAPSGTISITENGTYDVAAYAQAAVNVPTPETVSVVRTITIDTDLGAGTNTEKTILTADEFVKEHYADDGFSAMLIPVTPVASATGVGHWVYHCNRNIGSSNVVRYGYYAYSSSSSAVVCAVATAKLNGTGYNISLRAISTGDLNLYVASARTIKAGTYLVVLTYTG